MASNKAMLGIVGGLGVLAFVSNLDRSFIGVSLYNSS